MLSIYLSIEEEDADSQEDDQNTKDDSLSEAEVTEVLGDSPEEEPIPEFGANNFGDYIVALLSTGRYPVNLDKWHMAEEMNGPGLMHFMFHNREKIQGVLEALQAVEEEEPGEDKQEASE